MVFPQKKFSTVDEKVSYCAKVISGALCYKHLIDKKEIKTDFVGKFPLDMQQYDKIFGTCRIPGLKKDSLSFSPNSKHIVVIAEDNFFKVTVYSKSGKILSETEITDQLKICLQEANKLKSSKVGILTSDNRDNWAAAYEELVKIDHNRRALEVIQESLFTVSFDREMYSKDGDDTVTASHQLIHGGGSQYNSANRWYDKTVQFIVGTTGINGLTYEHSPAEGQPIAVLTDFVINYLKENKVVNSENVGVFERPMLLDFQTTSFVEASIKTAAQNIDKLGNDLDMNYLRFKDYGKNFIKAQKLSPDSFVQMAIQLAFYKLHKQPGAHYESAQTRIYVHGRTETIRSCSKESIAFAKAMCESTNDQDKLLKLRAAINSHKDYASLAIQVRFLQFLYNLYNLQMVFIIYRVSE